MHRSAPQLMLIVLLLGLVLMRESHDAPLADLEETFVNWLAANSAHSGAPAPLALIEINEGSLGTQHPWPWSPLDFALFLDDVLQFQPAALGIEPVTEWNPKELPADAAQKYSQFENILHERILLAPKIVLGAQLGFPEDPDVTPPLQPVPVLRHISGSTRDVPAFTVVERQPSEQLRLAASLGFTNVPVEKEPLRRAPLLFSYRGQIVPSFVLQALMLWFKLTPDDVNVDLGSQVSLGDKIAVPIDSAGAMLVDFGTPITRIGFEEMLLAVEQMEAKTKPLVPREAIANKLVVLARSDEAARIYSLPIGHKGSAGELFAAAIATVQNHAFIGRIGLWFDAIVIALFMWLSWFLYRRRRRVTVLITVLFILIYLMIGLAIFAASQRAVPLSLPFGLALFVALFRLFAPKEGLLRAA